ncbi:MAG: zinc ribbon domain-containing protein [Campylobacterales bacterium]|nr:zinc ribbon domain-containing protein [Campylobacterales bacterium]
MNEERMKMVECPYCKEDIKEGAIKCKHCNSMLNKIFDAKEVIHKEVESIKEKVFWTDETDQIKVTSNRFMVGSTSYVKRTAKLGSQ